VSLEAGITKTVSWYAQHLAHMAGGVGASSTS
jgi:hypothetical protein